ncbi:MAG: DNA-protecting protein DprA [Actinomycetota bacterium]|nr:DNA-protecting protein DprA [Actinomycetota bacterium]
MWHEIQSLVVSVPLTEAAEAVLERRGISHEHWRAALHSALRHSGALEPDDRVLALGDGDYPPVLAQVPGAPRFLFVHGRLELLDGRPALAVVGTREPTDAGRRRARKLGYLLAKLGIVVVSGLARGIDGEAHRGALAIGGDTVAVLGTPLSRTYPQEHAALQVQIGTVGALVSQFHPAAGIKRHFFPMRNATMSGLCLGTVVVEASETSGALIQARQCLQQGRKLFIPQSALDNPRLTWPKRFLSQGAHAFREIDDLMRVLAAEGLVEASGEPADYASPAHVVSLDVR